jgi:hypothetical protein
MVQGAHQDSAVADDQALRALVRQREIRLKGGRARLVNAAALDAWRGRSGLVRLDYRWPVRLPHHTDGQDATADRRLGSAS